jgi:hypothetical protein
MKELYCFKENKPEEVEEIDIIKNEKNEEIKQIKKIQKQSLKEFCIKKPSRFLFDEAEMFYAIKLSESIKAGMLTRTLMLKKYDSDGGIFTKDEEDKIKQVITNLANAQKRLLDIEEKEKVEGKLSDEDKATQEVVFQEVVKLRGQIAEIENAKNSLFEQTAETRARNKTIVWWILNLSYEKNQKGEYIPIFGESSYEQKLKKYYELDEAADPFMLKIIDKFTYFISFWYAGRINSTDDFKAVEDFYNGKAN